MEQFVSCTKCAERRADIRNYGWSGWFTFDTCDLHCSAGPDAPPQPQLEPQCPYGPGCRDPHCPNYQPPLPGQCPICREHPAATLWDKDGVRHATTACPYYFNTPWRRFFKAVLCCD